MSETWLTVWLAFFIDAGWLGINWACFASNSNLPARCQIEECVRLETTWHWAGHGSGSREILASIVIRLWSSTILDSSWIDEGTLMESTFLYAAMLELLLVPRSRHASRMLSVSRSVGHYSSSCRYLEIGACSERSSCLQSPARPF